MSWGLTASQKEGVATPDKRTPTQKEELATSGGDITPPTDNWIIYGHNMNNGSMFANILKYDDKNLTAPSIIANNVSSPPIPTLLPG